MPIIKIGKKIIDEKSPTYIIAEIGLNHQGDVKLAKTLIDLAAEAGADCVKFQKRSIRKVYKHDVLKNIDKEEHSSNYILHHIKKTELTESQMRELCNYSRKKGVDFVCTPWDEYSLKFLNKLNLPAYKIGSADMFNFRLIREVAKTGMPMLISTGMSYMSEIEQLISFLNSINAKYVILHCNSTYPAPYHDINLNYIKTLKDKFNCVVGYSGHEAGIAVSLAAVAMGAKVLEKHITMDRNLPGPDHKASLLPAEFSELVKQVKIIDSAMGEPIRFPSRGEYLNRETLSKSIVAARYLKRGTILKFSDLEFRSPGKGTNPLKLPNFIGKRLFRRDINKHDYVLESDIDPAAHFFHSSFLKNGEIKHKWGIVARMSDIDNLLHCSPCFIELHLTDSDVRSNKKYSKKYNLDLVIHGPEYDGDLLLDLCSLDDDIRQRSIIFFNKTLEYCRELKKLFKNNKEMVKFIIHPGGMSMEEPLHDKKSILYKNFEDSLKKIGGHGFELLVENMPPRPWYFGGQWHHAAFMSAEEMVAFSKRAGYGLVLDTSHAALYCNLYKKDLFNFVKKMLPYTKYVHISDAAGLNGEGLQIGDGSINFKPVLDLLVKTDLWVLPEIWQGHKFGGEGFLRAMHSLKLINQEF